MVEHFSVIRMGPVSENQSWTILRDALIDYFAQSMGEDPVANKASGRLQIANRYFRAQVRLQEIGSPREDLAQPGNAQGRPVTGPATTSDLATPKPTTTTWSEDGVILVFDAAKSNPDRPMSMTASFDSLDDIHEQAQRQGTAGDLLRLCVGVTLSPLSATELRGVNHEQEYSRRILWCLDRGYEYVEADLSVAGRSRSADDRDKEGFARIVEAMAGTVWSSAIMEGKKQKELKASYDQDMQALQGAKPQQQVLSPLLLPPEQQLDQAAPEEEDQDTTNFYEPPTLASVHATVATHAESDAAREMKARQAILDQSGIDTMVESEFKYAHLQELGQETNADETTVQQKTLRQERQQERFFDDLDGALRQAASIREASRSGSLTDDQRRQRAGDAALLLMDLLGKMGYDDDDDKEEGEEDDDETDGLDLGDEADTQGA